MFNRNVRVFVGLLMMMALLGSTIAAPPRSVKAGSNGQQIAVNVTCGNALYGPFLRGAILVGPNQNGEPIYWHSQHSGMTRSFTTLGWWWKGNVKLIYNLSNGRSSEMTVNVPAQMQGNIYAINITSCGLPA